jgi:hypothetical protein
MELLLTAIACFAALLLAAWPKTSLIFSRTKRLLQKISATPFRAAISIFIFATIVYVIPSLFRVPQPIVHDEFAYLLQADTFAHGRLANPPHPLAKFFETFHVLQSPTYAAKFPPSLGFALATGSLLGHPLIGMWICTALGCALIFWTLRAVLPLRWATLIALLAAIHPTIIWYSQIYWGGCTALIGAALLTGAMLRAIRTPTIMLGFIAGIGMSILAISRPFEGLLLSIAVAIALLICAFRDGKIKSLLKKFAPAAILLPAITATWLLYYNYRITGDSLLLPYSLHTQRYMAAPLFHWQPIPPVPNYPNEQMRKFHVDDELVEYTKQLGLKHYLIAAFDRFGMILWAYLRPILLAIPLIVALVFWRRSRTILVCGMICISVLLAHVLSCPWMRVQYMAPLVPCLFVLIGIGLRHINAWRIHNQPIGHTLVRAIIFTQIAIAIFSTITNAIANAKNPISQRATVMQSLLKQGGQHLVLVHYSEKHSPTNEWVYNAADIDRSPIIFARDLGPDADRELLSYYLARKIWIANIDNGNVDLQPLISK